MFKRWTAKYQCPSVNAHCRLNKMQLASNERPRISKIRVNDSKATTHTHTHTFNGSLSRTTQVSQYQKGKTNLDFTEARDSEWQWHQLGHVQVCTLFQTDNHASTPPLSFLQAGCPSCRPTNSIKALKQSNHTHTFNGPFSGTTQWAGTRKAKPIWILLKQETVSGSGISWAICKSAPGSRQITMPAPHRSIFLHAGCPSCRPTNSVKALKAGSKAINKRK